MFFFVSIIPKKKLSGCIVLRELVLFLLRALGPGEPAGPGDHGGGGRLFRRVGPPGGRRQLLVPRVRLRQGTPHSLHRQTFYILLPFSLKIQQSSIVASS